MTTRAQITIEGSSCYIYKHADGYPEGVLPTLTPFVHAFFANRGYDPEYFVARCVAFFAADWDAERRKLARKERRAGRIEAAERWERPEFLGLGVSTDVHGDIEFLYTVRRDGTIEVRGRGHVTDNGDDPRAWPIVKVVPFPRRPLPSRSGNVGAPSVCVHPMCTRRARPGRETCSEHWTDCPSATPWIR